MAFDVNVPRIKLKRPESEFGKVTFGDWGTLGESEITQNFDGTYRLEVEEKSDLHHNGNLILRETIFNVRGYDVRKPINIEMSHENNSTVSMWFGVGLGTTPYSGIRTRVCAGAGKGSVISDPFHADPLVANGGVYVYVWMNMIQNGATGGMTDFITNRTGTYVSHSNLDRITYEVGEESTKLYYNDLLMFDDINVKLSDFDESGGKAYPFFMFVETPVNPNRNNVLHIKGVNAPLRETYGTVQYRDDAAGDLKIPLQNYGSNLKIYEDKECSETIDENLYDYDTEKGILSISKLYFSEKPYKITELFAVNEGGIEYIPVRYIDSLIPVGAPVLSETEFVYRKGSKENIILYADMNNRKFSRVYGAGMFLKDSIYNEVTERLIIMSSFLENLDAGEYEIHVESVDEDEIYMATTLKLTVLSDDETGNGGCGSSAVISGSALLGTLILTFMGVYLVIKRK